MEINKDKFLDEQIEVLDKQFEAIDELFRYLVSKVSIVDVVESYPDIELDKTGIYPKTECPLCQSALGLKTFHINEEKNLFYCFSCHKNGDPISFVSIMNKCSTNKAAMILHDDFKIKIPGRMGKKLAYLNNISGKLLRDSKEENNGKN